MVGKGKSSNIKPKIKPPKPGGRTQGGKVSKKKARFQQLAPKKKSPTGSFAHPAPPKFAGVPAHQVKKMKANRASQLQQGPKTNARVPYTSEQTILVIGDGDFSFSRGLCEVMTSGHNVLATTLDDEMTMRAKYAEANKEGLEPGEKSRVLENIKEIKETYNGEVMFDLDSTKMATLPKFKNYWGHFERVVFNFPHAGKGIKDQTRNIKTNQLLLQGFFENAVPLLTKNGEIHVTIKSGEPYDSWDMVKIARGEKLEVRDCIVFNPDLYPGYEHRRTLGFKAGFSAERNEEIKRKLCKTYMFKVKVYDPNAKNAKMKALQLKNNPRLKRKKAERDHENDDD